MTENQKTVLDEVTDVLFGASEDGLTSMATFAKTDQTGVLLATVYSDDGMPCGQVLVRVSAELLA